MNTSVSSRAKKLAAILLTITASIWAVLRIGPSTLPDLGSFVQRIGGWRDSNLPSDIEYIRENIPYQVLYEALGSHGVSGYFIQWAITSSIAMVGLAFWYADSAGEKRRLMGVRLALLSPIVAIFIGFIGSYDSLTVVGVVGLLWGWRLNSRILVVVSSAFLGFHHWGQALPMTIALLITSFALSKGSPWFDHGKSLLWSPFGVLLGKGLSLLTLWLVTGSPSGSRLGATQSSVVYDTLVTSVNHFPILLYSLFAGSWIIVLMVLSRLATRSKYLLILAVGLCFILAVAITDQTRVFILLSLPSLALMTRWLMSNPSTSRSDLIVVEASAWLLTPVLLWTNSLGRGELQYTGALDQLIMFTQSLPKLFAFVIT